MWYITQNTSDLKINQGLKLKEFNLQKLRSLGFVAILSFLASIAIPDKASAKTETKFSGSEVAIGTTQDLSAEDIKNYYQATTNLILKTEICSSYTYRYKTVKCFPQLSNNKNPDALGDLMSKLYGLTKTINYKTRTYGESGFSDIESNNKIQDEIREISIILFNIQQTDNSFSVKLFTTLTNAQLYFIAKTYPVIYRNHSAGLQYLLKYDKFAIDLRKNFASTASFIDRSLQTAVAAAKKEDAAKEKAKVIEAQAGGVKLSGCYEKDASIFNNKGQNWTTSEIGCGQGYENVRIVTIELPNYNNNELNQKNLATAKAFLEQKSGKSIAEIVHFGSKSLMPDEFPKNWSRNGLELYTIKSGGTCVRRYEGTCINTVGDYDIQVNDISKFVIIFKEDSLEIFNKEGGLHVRFKNAQ